MFYVQRRDGVNVIRIEHDLDVFSGPALASAIALAESDPARIVIVFDRCTYCDSTGLSVLYKSRKRLGSRFAIVVPRESVVHRVFEITGLTKSLSLCDSFEDALRAP